MKLGAPESKTSGLSASPYILTNVDLYTAWIPEKLCFDLSHDDKPGGKTEGYFWRFRQH